MNRILFAAPKSGSGKTMITCGMIALCKRMGKNIAAFKCGPDYIDPMFHRMVLEVPSANLDTYFTGEEMTKFLFCERAEGKDIAIIEGVMGYYDGLAGQSDKASTYEVAKVTDTPVILIIDGKGASVSLAAVIKGLMEYRKDSRICGVILNRVSAGYYDRIKTVIEQECHIPVAGYLPELKHLQIPSRHLGLVQPEEIASFRTWMDEVADEMEKTIDIGKLLEIAASAEELKSSKEIQIPRLQRPIRLAVARDEAFSFYYTENLELLEKMGAEIVTFSPLHDKALPEEIDGLLLGGGYPERYARQLEENEEMRTSVFTACKKGMPHLAECGGFLYLQQELEGTDGYCAQMAGVYSGKGYQTEKLSRFGYVELRGKLTENRIRGHEFHYWDCTENGSDFIAEKPLSDRKYPCMIQTANGLVGFPHLYYYSNPQLVFAFLEDCARFQAAGMAKKHWDQIAKPIDSLGMLEDYVVRICKMQGNPKPYDIKKRALLALCGDHGVVAEGVTQTGSEVTKVVSDNFAKGVSTVNRMAKVAGVDVFAVDMGIDCERYPEKNVVTGVVIDRKIARGTNNLAVTSAMTREQCVKALQTGMDLVGELKEQGYKIIATGEMGIGNTTPTSVLAAIFLNLDADKVTGRGAGLSKEGLSVKKQVVSQAVKRIRNAGCRDAVDILAEGGGFEIAGMAGVFLGGVKYHIPIVIDGAISSVAALTAWKINPKVSDYVLASHESEEITGKLALEKLGVEAILHGRMCLGEGTGAMALFPLLDMAFEVYREMGTFEDYALDAYERFE